LGAVLLPEIVPADQSGRERFEHTLTVLGRLEAPEFPLALGMLLHDFVEPDTVGEIGRRWRLSNNEIDRARWLVRNRAVLTDAQSMPWSALQPILITEGIDDLLALHEAITPGGDAAAHCRRLLEQAPEVLNPPPLLTGDDLLVHGVPSGPQYRELLDRIRAAQLDGEIHTKEEALALVDQLRET
jgi:poly(A) polymerase